MVPECSSVTVHSTVLSSAGGMIVLAVKVRASAKTGAG